MVLECITLLREIDGYYSHHVLRRGKIAGVFRVFKDSAESWRIGINAELLMVKNIIDQISDECRHL